MFQSKVRVYCQSTVPGGYQLAALEWYNGAHGYVEPNCATLAVCFTNGRCQFMRTELDEGMKHSGSVIILAVCLMRFY